MIRFLINWLNAWRSHRESRMASGYEAPSMRSLPNDVTMLSAIVQRGVGCWAAKQPGECGTCGHEWIPGEVVGVVEQAYVRVGDGMVKRSPATRVVCGLCVEQQRVQGDLSLVWAREAGML